MSDYPGNPEEVFKANAISDVLRTLNGEVQGYILALQKFKQYQFSISQDEWAVVSYKINELKNSLASFKNQAFEPSGNEENSELLPQISSEVNKIAEKLRTLSTLSQELKTSISKLGKDASNNSKVEIEVKFVDDQWRIKAYCSDECDGNFRNVSIWEVESQTEVCKFLLLEPKVTLKKILNTQLYPTNHLIAKIGEKIVSHPFLIPTARIKDISLEERGLLLKIENLTNEDIENIHIVSSYSCDILGVVSLEALSPLEVNIKMMYGDVNIYLEKDGKILCSAFEVILPDQEDDPDHFENDIINMTENQKVIARYLKENFLQLDGDTIVSAINMCNTEDYNVVYRYLQSTRAIP